MRRLAALVSLALLALGCGIAYGPGSGARFHTSLADEERREAQIDADPAALARILHEDLVYRHSDGREETKSELIESLVSGAVDYRDIRVDDLSVARCGRGYLHEDGSYCVRALQTLDVSVGGEDFTVPSCYRARYVPAPGESLLVLIAYESSMLSGDGECPLP